MHLSSRGHSRGLAKWVLTKGHTAQEEGLEKRVLGCKLHRQHNI